MNTDETTTSFSSDDASQGDNKADNLHREQQENSANGLDSTEVTGGQNGRNIRGMGSQDMDSANGVLRLNDQDDTTMQVTDQAIANAAASEGQTKTATVSVTTSGPDDYASDPKVGVPNAQKEAKKQDDDRTDAEGDDDSNAAVSQEEKTEDVAETGTSLDHQPAY